MIDLKGKKLLVIGGAFQHCKLVEAAKELGVTVGNCNRIGCNVCRQVGMSFGKKDFNRREEVIALSIGGLMV